jgi:hypothetical protein
VETLGTHIKSLRKSPGPGQEHLLKQISTIQSYISAIGPNKKTPNEELTKATSYRWRYDPVWILGGKEEEALCVAEWPGRYPELTEVIVAWAPAPVNGALSKTVVDPFQVEAKAKARYLLQSPPKGADATGG